jgi:hypothetical protein
MFTRITHPTDGRELQIKTGMDDLETYKVGDPVDWHIDERNPGYGKLFDGVYNSYSDLGEDDWVVIKGHHVIEVLDIKSLRYTSLKDAEQAFDIVPFERGWWGEDLWLKKELREKEHALKELQEEVEFLRTLTDVPADQIKGKRREWESQRMAKGFLDLFTGPGLARQILPPKEES